MDGVTWQALANDVHQLDRSNLANAYVSGMKEELGFRGDQFNQINTCFTVGYIVGQIPSNLSLQYVKVCCPLLLRLVMGIARGATDTGCSPESFSRP